MSTTCERCGRRPAVVTDEQLGDVCGRCWVDSARSTVALEPEPDSLPVLT